MTHERFVGFLEAYYGRWPRAMQKKTVEAYLARYSEAQLDVLSKRLVLEYTGQYRFTPDVAILEGVARKIDAEADGWGSGPRLLPEPLEPEDGGEALTVFTALVDKLTRSKLTWRLRKGKLRQGNKEHPGERASATEVGEAHEQAT